MRKPLLTGLNRSYFKVNASNNEEEMILKIAELTGFPIERIKVDIAKEKDRSHSEYLSVQGIIKPFKEFLESEPKTKSDKYEELQDLGRFILATKLDIKIVVPKTSVPYPDFTLVLEEKATIGLEHTRLINEKMRRTTKTTQKLLQDSTKYIQQINAVLSGIVNIAINFDAPIINGKSLNKRGFTEDERKRLPSILGNYIYAILNNQVVEKPEFIKSINVAANPGFPLNVELSEQYFAMGGFRELVEDRISAKEKRFLSYKSESRLERIWLLLTVDGFSSHSGFDLVNEIFIYKKMSEFELIIVFEVFSGKCFLIYDKLRNKDI